MRSLVFLRSFKTDFKKIQNNARKRQLVVEALNLLQHCDGLPSNYREHPLKGKYSGTLECHVAPDLLLVYIRKDDCVELIRVGSHATLFK